MALGDVELFGVQAGWSAGGAVALEPAGSADVFVLLVVGECHPEPAQQESAFGLAERPFVGSVAVAVAVLGEFCVDGVQGGERPRVAGGDRSADGGEQERGVGARVGGGTLPASGRVLRALGGVGDDVVGEFDPCGGLLAARAATADGAQAGGAR